MIFFSLFFGLAIVAFSALRVGRWDVVQAQENQEVAVIELSNDQDQEATESSEADLSTVSNMAKSEVDYYLPYPGILPDHPLYWLKMLRDKVALSLTRKPLAKFERLLLYADKRVGAAEALIEGNKIELGVTTADKAEKYLEQAVVEFEGLAKNGQAQPELHDRLDKALLKHQEILVSFLDKVPDQSRDTLNQAVEKTERNYQKIKNQFD